MTNDTNDKKNTKNNTQDYDPNINVAPDVPTHRSPLLWMGAVMFVFIVLTTMSFWGREKISITASPVIPELSASAQRGRVIINSQCTECHGVDATGGSRKGPPLLHPMYRDEVFPDFHFKRVLREGRKERSWNFGPMPAQPQLSDQDMTDIIAFIREVQKATGVE